MPKEPKILNLKGADFTLITQEVLGREKILRFKAKGESMHPFIRDGDILEITPANGEKVRVGEVIFYRVGEKRMVAHRVTERITENGRLVFVTKGDSNVAGEERVYPEKIMGRVRTIERKGRKICIDSGLNSFFHIFYLKIPLVLIKTRRVGGILIRHLQGARAYRDLAKKLIGRKIRYKWEPCDDSTKHLLARRGGKIIGRATVNNLLKMNSHYHGWWIFGMWVAWQYRGLGVASRLTEMLCQFARKEEAFDVKLLVFEDSKPALNLYKKLGFYQTHIPQIDKELREETRKTGRQRIIMKRDLARELGPT